MFRVGQKVVCVDDRNLAESGDSKIWHGRDISEGEVYTIRWIGLFRDEVCVRLVGVHRETPAGYISFEDPDVPFRATRFRPVVERKTDISLFTAMLNPAKKKRRADRIVTVS